MIKELTHWENHFILVRKDEIETHADAGVDLVPKGYIFGRFKNYKSALKNQVDRDGERFTIVEGKVWNKWYWQVVAK